MTCETFDQSDEETWPDQNKDNDKDKEQWLTCDIWDTDYNSDNWEPELLTTFVTSQLRVTLDSIPNSEFETILTMTKHMNTESGILI